MKNIDDFSTESSFRIIREIWKLQKSEKKQFVHLAIILSGNTLAISSITLPSLLKGSGIMVFLFILFFSIFINFYIG